MEAVFLDIKPLTSQTRRDLLQWFHLLFLLLGSGSWEAGLETWGRGWKKF